MNVPFNLDHPYWVDDPDFDLDFHVRHTAVAPPGDDEQIAELVARIIGRPLDRSRPLWESYVIEGLPDDRFAHPHQGPPRHHRRRGRAPSCSTLMLDGDPEGDEIEPPEDDWRPERAARATARCSPGPPPTSLRKPGRGGAARPPAPSASSAQTTRNPVVVAAANQVRDGLRGPLGAVLNIGRERSPEGETVGPLPTAPRPARRSTPPSPPHRRFAFRSTSLELVKDIKNALGATVNDVVMAVCAGGLRTWLETHDALPDAPLVAMVPVSIRTGEETEKWTNRVSSIFASLPDRRARPAAAGARRSTRRWSAPRSCSTRCRPTRSPTSPSSRRRPCSPGPCAPPPGSARRFALPVNVVISNVPGPREPLYTAGARLLHYYPVSTIVDGQGLNITVQSYLDTLDFGLVACRELVPDLWDMVDAIVDDLEGLAKAAGVDRR